MKICHPNIRIYVHINCTRMQNIKCTHLLKESSLSETATGRTLRWRRLTLGVTANKGRLMLRSVLCNRYTDIRDLALKKHAAAGISIHCGNVQPLTSYIIIMRWKITVPQNILQLLSVRTSQSRSPRVVTHRW